MQRRTLLLGSIPAAIAVGCGNPDRGSSSPAIGLSPAANPAPETTAAAISVESGDAEPLPPRAPLSISLSLYVVLEESEQDEFGMSSQRTEADLEEISGNMSEIWSQADIIFDPVTISTIRVPPSALEGIVLNLDTDAFFDQIGQTFNVPDPSAVNGFYVRGAGRVNGFAPSGSRVFFVVDEPSVHDERVSSHEVGHIFGLHHQLADAGTLMFSGTNGTVLTQDEQTVTRYTAQGILDGAR